MNLTRIKKLIPRLSALLFLLAAILLLIYSAPVRKGVSAGLESCAAVLIPSLFPFMVLSGVLVESRAADSIQRILGPVVKRFFHLPACTACTVFMGFIGGYPVGAKMTASLLEQKRIDSKTAVRLLCFCVNAGPSFLITAVGTGLLRNGKAGLLLLGCQWTSAILIGLWLGFLNRHEILKNEKENQNGLPFSSALVHGVQSGIDGMLSVIGYVLLFSAIIELFFTFLTESCWYQNVVGYYYYKTGECPAAPDQVKKIVIFPNASIKGNVPYLNWYDKVPGGATNYGSRNAPLETNRKVQLLFQDDQGNLSTKFPAGYTIGYFIIADGFKCGSKGHDGFIDTDKSFVYSNEEWNKNYQGQKARFISLSAEGGTVVYGVEDGGDSSYEDLLFCIDANPNEAIQDPDRPVIDPDEPEVSETENNYMSFAYEDIWPSGGDYDLNDVIIEYHRSITFNKDNYVSEVKETYEPVQKVGAATNRNAFAVQYATDQRGEMVLPSGAVDETQTNSIILFPNAMDVRNQKFVITRTFAAGAMKKDALKVGNSILNPYIIVNYEGAGKDNRTEVHLPKSKATNLANSDQIGKEADAYYVNKDGKHPFAISIPGTFTSVTETVTIDKEYPDFEKWVESDGKEYTDWYKNYQKSAN